MDKADLHTKLIDYIDGKLEEAEKAMLEQKIKDDQAVAMEYNQLQELLGVIESRTTRQPDKSLETEFLSMLEDEIIGLETALEDVKKTNRGEKAKVFGLKPTLPLGIAAAVALVLIGGLIGIFLIKSGQDEQISLLKKELDTTRAMIINSLQNQSSPSRRITGINASFELNQADDEIVSVLIYTMNNDSNINVRLAAIEALYRFSSEEKIRNALVNTLATQKEPVIQLTLINMLVKLREDRAIQPMQKLIEDKETLESVKDEAWLGLYKLS